MTNRKECLLAVDYLNRRLVYDSETGWMIWRIKDGTTSSVKSWNTNYAGKRAGWINPTDGYRYISVDDDVYAAHRVVWFMKYETPAVGEIDHINHIRDDNRINNLREVTSQENQKNRPISSANTSGVVGVSQHGRGWRAWISADGRRRYLGTFLSIRDAEIARQLANAEFGFHENHGKPYTSPRWEE